jgi:hypothetical protein
MVKVNIGDKVKDLSNNLYVRSVTNNIDPNYWYVEIYGHFPVYQLCVDIDREDDDEDFDIYNRIYENLVGSGEFTPLKYDYNRDKKTTGSDGNTIREIYADRYYLVHNTEPLMITYEFGALSAVTHLGRDELTGFVDKYLMVYNQDYDSVKCSIIVKDPNMYLDDFDINLDCDLDFDLYNDGFENIHRSIVESIKNDKNGLYFLYGKAGTGKTTYIRHLIKECATDKRKFIYVPTKLFGDFTDPGILPFLLSNRGCVYIIEDCESLVTVDGGMRNESIADLLNMTDGLLADALNIKIICTFNSDYDKIDNALLRPGRCRCKYEFDLLSKDKANKVAKKLNLREVNRDVSLAELFNPDIGKFEEKKKRIGFSS